MTSPDYNQADMTSDAKRRLLAQILRKKASNRTPALTLEPISRDIPLPLSFSQERLWFLSQLEPDSLGYNLSGCVRFKGRLNSDTLKQSLSEIVRRHEILRTTFHDLDGKPVQVIAPPSDLDFHFVDMEELPQVDRELAVQQLALQEAQRQLDLSKGPLFRMTLVRLGDLEHVLIILMHHIITDGWSFGILRREFCELYKALAAGNPQLIPELHVQYADYAYWERQRLQGEALDKHLSYWKEKLGGELTTLNLPTDRPRPTLLTHAGAEASLGLPQNIAGAIKELSRSEGVTVFMTLLAAFKALLCRITGQEDIVVGTPIAGRNRTELERLIGMFVNTLVLRTDISGNPTFRELLARVRETALGAYAHQDIPFEKLVEVLAPERDLSRTPLFQILFNQIVDDDYIVDLPGLEIDVFGNLRRESNFDITLYVEEKNSEINLTALYNANLFSQERIICLLEQYRGLLAQIIADARKPIRSYSLVTPESRRILPDPGAVIEEPPQVLVTDRFRSWVEQTPQRPALSLGNQTLTYAQLCQRAENLAKVLQKLGAEQKDVVAVCGPRNFGLIASIMAVLLNRNVLLPIDDNLPLQRQQLMIRESGAKFLISVNPRGLDNKGLAEPPVHNVNILGVNPEGLSIELEGTNLGEITLPQLSIDDAAYIIFTSGTTGIPKGVLGSHKGLSHFLSWQRETFDISPGDRVAQFTSLTFDPVLREIFVPLISGATLCLTEGLDILASNDVFSWLEQEHISIVHTVPTLAQSWLTTATVKLPQSDLRLVFFAGEPLTENLVQKWLPAFPNAKIINLYGPTETTLAKCYYSVSNEDQHSDILPLGRPLPQTQVLILSEQKKLCGIGEPGEIVVRTPFRSFGYINSEEANKKHFVKNWFRDDDDDYLYFTGDRGRYRPDGKLEFLGRVDDQIKIRGVRVEPGEIAMILSRHPQVDSCFVMARKDEQRQASLVAYVVATEQNSITVSDLRTYLKKRLPATMVPEDFVFLDALPVTPRGKIDRRALPAPDRSKPELGDFFEAPRNQSEELIADIWRKVLHREQIGVHDNFFDLGGHSLLVMQVISRIRETFQTELPLRALFETPTVAGLAACIEATNDSGKRLQTPPPLYTTHRDGAPELSFAQQRLWFLHHLEPDSVAYSILSSVRLSGDLDQEAIERAFFEIARRHEVLRTTFATANGKPVLNISNDPNILFERIDLRPLPASDREARALQLSNEDGAKPFDLAIGPLLRLHLFQLADDEHLLHLNMHHIISDFWSLRVMSQELQEIYTSFVQEIPLRLPALPIQYADFACFQRQWLQGEVLEEYLSYWNEKLGGELTTLDLPTDRPRPKLQTHRGDTHSLDIPKTLLEGLRVLSRREGVSLFMVLLATFKLLLHRYTGQEDIIVGTPIAGRDRTELEGLIGFFINTIVMRTDLSGNPDFIELLGRVRDTALGAYAHQAMPFEKLVEELAPTRDLSRTPIFQVFFNHIRVDESQITLPGLKVEAIPRIDHEPKFDMTLYVFEREDAMNLTVLYNADLFNSERIGALLTGFETLLFNIVENPREHISDYNILTEEQRTRIKKRRNVIVPENAFSEFPKHEIEQSISKRFEAHVDRHSNKIAIKTRRHTWTYGHLNLMANRVANTLLDKAARSDDKVALLFEQDVQMIAAVLGTLKAGMAYVPLDPDYPVDRLRYMVEDAAANVLLTNDVNFKLSNNLSMGNIDVINIDDSSSLSEDSENPKIHVDPDTIAYILYTSGSTGRPKGVIQNHRNVLHFARVYTNALHITDSDRLSLLSSYSFDAAVMDIYGALLNGATLYPINLRDGGFATMPQWFAEQKISIYHSTPTVYRAFVDSLPDGLMLPSVRLIVLGGEAVFKRDVDAYRRYFGSECLFVNGLGPTESTMALQFFIGQQEVIDQPRVPVGYAVDDTEILLLNAEGRPDDIHGEIGIRSPYVALGYWNQHDKTKAAFLSDPTDGKRRIYRTGDLGRRLADGSIEFLGRNDDQVKIRGYRIEIGEIENALSEHTDIKKVAVIAKLVNDDNCLIAYFEANEAQSFDDLQLRQYLQKKLPSFMIPTAFIRKEALPLTPTKKIDRKALQHLNADFIISQSKVGATGVFAPRTLLETQLVAIWENVLGVSNIGLRDNFFDLGGHSLLVLSLLDRMEKVFKKRFPLSTIFQAQNIETLAAAMMKDSLEFGGSLVTIQMGGSRPPLFIIPGVGGSALGYNELAQLLGAEQPVYCLQSVGLDGLGAPLERIEDIASHFYTEIRKVQPDGPYHIAGFCVGGGVAFEIAQQLTAQGQKVATLVQIQTFSPIGSRTRLRVPAMLQQLGFAIRGMVRHLRSFKDVGIGQWFAHFNNKSRIVKEIVKTRDLYRGDRTQFYLELVQRANSRAFSRYSPKSYKGSIIFIMPSYRDLSGRTNPSRHWGNLAELGLKYIEIPGEDSGSLLRKPNVQALAEVLSDQLEKSGNNS